MTRNNTRLRIPVEVWLSVSLEILGPVRNELLAVERKLQSRSSIMREIDPIGSLGLTPLERMIRPGVVLLGTRLFNFMSDQVVSLGAMVQFIHLARLMHEKVKEPQEGCAGASARPILLGDYFYGRLFELAAESGLTRFLRPLSEIVCQAAESSIRELTDEPLSETVEFVYDQTAALFGGGMALGFELVGARAEEIETVRRFGLNLGMGYGLIGRGISAGAAVYREGALAELEKLPEGLSREALRDVVLYIFDRPADGRQ